MDKKEYEARKEFLLTQVDAKKLEVEKALLALENLCKEILKIDEELKKENEVKSSTV